MLSSRESSQPWDQTNVSLIAGRFFTIWATREAQGYQDISSIRTEWVNEWTRKAHAQYGSQSFLLQPSDTKRETSRMPNLLIFSPWNSLGQNTGVGNLSFLQGIFPTQGSYPGLMHCRQILYQLSHKESPRILEWVAYPFPSGSSQTRNWTTVSCIAGGFFTNWAIREAPR